MLMLKQPICSLLGGKWYCQICIICFTSWGGGGGLTVELVNHYNMVQSVQNLISASCIKSLFSFSWINIVAFGCMCLLRAPFNVNMLYIDIQRMSECLRKVKWMLAQILVVPLSSSRTMGRWIHIKPNFLLPIFCHFTILFTGQGLFSVCSPQPISADRLKENTAKVYSRSALKVRLTWIWLTKENLKNRLGHGIRFVYKKTNEPGLIQYRLPW